MALYRITLELKSSLITPLKGDTIWGHIVWGIANHEGEQAVSSFLEEQKQQPELVVSSAFPEGYVCRPIPKPRERKEALNVDSYTDIKKSKKRRIIKASTLLKGVEEPPKDIDKPNIMTVSVTHNTMDRRSGAVLEGGLYSQAEDWISWDNNRMDIYIESSYSADRLRTLIEWAFENGYGADASTGKGNISVVADSLTQVELIYDTGLYMSLAPFVIDPCQNIRNLRADTFVRSGRLGGEFSDLSPFKKTVVLFSEGAVFESDDNMNYCGRLLTNIHADPRICQSGFAPVIPVREEDL